MVGQLLEPLDGSLAQRRSIARDRRLAGLFHSRQPAVKRLDQLLELADQIRGAQRHDDPPIRPPPIWPPSRREPFQISPHLVQRQ